MENNETWREKIDALPLGDERDIDGTLNKHLVKELFAGELLSLADKIGAEKKPTDGALDDGLYSSETIIRAENAALDTAISLIKEMAK